MPPRIVQNALCWEALWVDTREGRSSSHGLQPRETDCQCWEYYSREDMPSQQGVLASAQQNCIRGLSLSPRCLQEEEERKARREARDAEAEAQGKPVRRAAPIFEEDCSGWGEPDPGKVLTMGAWNDLPLAPLKPIVKIANSPAVESSTGIVMLPSSVLRTTCVCVSL